MTIKECFICYSSKDALEFAQKLTETLERESPNLSVWFDKRDLPPSHEWEKQLNNALRNCKYFLFVITPHSLSDTSYCQKEWDRALNYKKDIITLQVVYGTDVPIGLQSYKNFDFRKNFDIGFSKLQNCLNGSNEVE